MTAAAEQVQVPPCCSRRPDAPARDRAVGVQQQPGRRVVVEDGDAGPADAGAHHPHVLRAPDAGVPVRLPVPERPWVVGVELGQPFPGHLHRPVHPVGLGQVSPGAGPLGDLGVSGLRRQVPMADPGRRGDAGGAAVSLVDQDDVDALLGGRERGPGARQAASDYEDAGGQIGVVGVVGQADLLPGVGLGRGTR
jgi:hypothetical protein